MLQEVDQLKKIVPEQVEQFRKSFAERVQHITRLPKDALEWIVTRPRTQSLVRKISPYLTESGLDMTEFDFTDFDRFNEPVDPINTVVVAVLAHFSYEEGITLQELTRKFRRKFDFIWEVKTPVSQTLYDGRQGPVKQSIYCDVGIPLMAKSGISPIHVYTENDKTKRNAEPTHEEQRVILKEIKAAVQDNHTAIALFAGGKVEPGRHKKDGTLNGLGEVTDSFLPLILQLSKRDNKRILVIPVGITDSQRLISAEWGFLTQESAWNLFKKVVGLPVDKLASARVGKPFFAGEEITRDNINQVVMGEHIAPLVREDARGFYSVKTPVNAA